MPLSELPTGKGYWRVVPEAPFRTDLGPVVVTGIVAVAAGAIWATSFALGQASGLGLLIEFGAAMTCLGAMIGLLGFGVAATLRRGALLVLALGFVLTPLVCFVWALYRRRLEFRQDSDPASPAAP